MSLDGARVLVTGGAGFIGSHLTEALLAAGAEVTVYDNFDGFYQGKEANLEAARAAKGFRLVVGDILDPAKLDGAMAGADVVIHEAGQAGVGFSIKHPLVANRTNVVGTLSVLSLARKHAVKRVVSASSSSIFGRPERLPIDEDHPKRPTSPYGVSKLSAEQYGEAFHRVYGTPFVSLRYFSVYGPRGRPDQVVHRFTEGLAQGKAPVVSGDGSHSRDFTHVSDIVDATMRAATSEGASGNVFNIGYGARTTILDLATRLIDIMGLKGRVEPAHAPEATGDFPHTQADNRKAKALLGWEPKVSLDEGLKQYVDWYLASGRREAVSS